MTIRKILFVALLSSLVLAACAGQAQVGEPTPAYPEPGYPSPDEPVTAPAYPGPEEPSDAPWQPQAGDEQLDRGAVFIDSSEILTLESFPPQFMLHLEGSLPTPCHQPRVEVSEPDKDNQIRVEAYSVVDPERVCIQVLEPLDLNVPLGSFPEGDYTVWVNGEQVGELMTP